jgi:hypothetical protein
MEMSRSAPAIQHSPSSCLLNVGDLAKLRAMPLEYQLVAAVYQERGATRRR